MYSKFKGSALLTALFIMSLIAIIATSVSIKIKNNISRTSLVIKADKLQLASDIVKYWAMDHLSQKNLIYEENIHGGIVKKFPSAQKNIYQGVNLSGEIYDLQAFVNLNNVQDETYLPVIVRLFKNVNLESKKQTMALFNGLFHWTNVYQPDRGFDEYLQYYAKQSPPYAPSFQPLVSLSELKLIKGFTNKIINIIERYVTTLPPPTAINVLSAPKLVIKSLSSQMTDQDVQELLELRSNHSFNQTFEIMQLLRQKGVAHEVITFKSKYYLVKSTAQIEDSVVVNYTLLKREVVKNKKVNLKIIRESINAF